ncbi:hypothetical protein GAY28_01485 [Azospirillum brasilense]|nr:hypothetical protein [Azospirillum brasilense]
MQPCNTDQPYLSFPVGGMMVPHRLAYRKHRHASDLGYLIVTAMDRTNQAKLDVLPLATQLRVTPATVRRYLATFVEADMLRPLEAGNRGDGTYAVNPYWFLGSDPASDFAGDILQEWEDSLFAREVIAETRKLSDAPTIVFSGADLGSNVVPFRPR